jgi:uncharacterized protein YndB with AHSA1/START domain
MAGNRGNVDMADLETATRAAPDEAPTLTITRSFIGPAALVFRAWTQAEHLVRWLGPRSHPAREVEVDFRVGGRWRACLRTPEGDDMWMGGTYREIDPPNRLAMTFAWDSTGFETLVTIRLEEQGERTVMHFHQQPFVSTDSRDSHQEGWSSSFDRLAEFVAGLER